MSDGNGLPEGFTKGWPPADPRAFVDDITKKWENRPGQTNGKHWALQLFGNNPISGYRIVLKQSGSNDP
jgi:hypothetical protein